jgi:hypothetical protein
MDWADGSRIPRESLSGRRVTVTLGVAATMGVVEWLGLGHPIGLLFGLCMGVLALLVAPLPWLAILPWGLRRAAWEVAARSLAVLAISAGVVVAAWTAYSLAIRVLVPVPHPLLRSAYAFLAGWPSVVCMVPLFAAAGWGLARHLELERRLEVHDVRAIELHGALEQARLLALRSRLDPHFLFNTLNLVAELCRDDPLEAERCVVRMSALLRAALDHSEHPLIPLGRELDLCADYLDLCRVRFGKRLAVEVVREPEALAARVPPLAVQVLCENAVRHGVERRPDGGKVQVTARVMATALAGGVGACGGVEPAGGSDGVALAGASDPTAAASRSGGVEVQITSPGPFLGERPGGIGLELTRRRLALAFGDQAGLEIATAPGGNQTIARLRLPANSGTPASTRGGA